MRIRTRSLQFPSVRSALTRIHRDLFTIDEYVLAHTPRHPIQTVEKMTLILEDRRFFSHFGVDLKACLREILRALLFQPHGGASTIDMQFVRTATGYREITLRRKLYEALLSVLIQFKYSKIEIFRSYLSCAFLGSGIKGIKIASLRLFNKTPDELSIDEAAEIAAMLVYPRPLYPTEA